jgi:hypothetical protein
VEKADKEQRFQDFNIRFFRGVGRLDNDNCDRMIIEHPRGKREDVGIYSRDGRHIAAWWRQALAIAPGSSLEIPISSGGTWFLEAMDSENQTRILEIHQRMQSEP